MINKILFLFLFGCISSLVYAEEDSLIFSYATDDLVPWGKRKAETYDVAICIDEPGLAGKKITEITAYVNGVEDLNNVSIWLTRELTLENKVNVPDIASWDVQPFYVDKNGYVFGELHVSLEEPFILTEESLYVGYTINVESISNENLKYPIIISEGFQENGLFLRTSKSILKWQDYTMSANGVAAIYVTLEGEFPLNCAGVKKLKETYSGDGEPFTVETSLMNFGTNPIEQIDYIYEVDGLTLNGHMDFETPVIPNIVNPTIVEMPFDAIHGVGTHELTVTITKVNSVDNESVSASCTGRINVIAFVPAKRVLMEEYTGTWCGWCTRGYLAMELIAEFYGDDVVRVAYHNGDAMTVTKTYPVYVPGFPNASINRGDLIDPYYGNYKDFDFGISFNLDEALDGLAIGEIIPSAILDGDIITVTSETRFIQDFEDANLRIGYVLVANGLKNSEWVQSNYYSGSYDLADEDTYLFELIEWPASVKNLEFNDVAIDVKAMMGINGSLPDKIELGKNYSNIFTFDIKENELVQNRDCLTVAAFIVDGNDGHIINANMIPVTNMSQVQSTDEIIPVKSSVFYNLEGRKITNPDHGLFIKIDTLVTGEQKASKILL